MRIVFSNFSVDSEIGNRDIIFFCSQLDEAQIPHLRVESRLVLIYLFSVNELALCERDRMMKYEYNIFQDILRHIHVCTYKSLQKLFLKLDV